MGKTGRLNERVAFDEPTGTADAFGGTSTAWTQRHECAAEITYDSGVDGVEAGRDAGRAVFRVRVRSCALSRAITAGYRMRNLRAGLPSGEDGDALPGYRYSIIAPPDGITDRAWVYIRVAGQVVS